ncbi:MAG: ferredoxin [Pseudomonadota bacterium]|nr:ferredoxin [Pseudomonadota bacterium]
MTTTPAATEERTSQIPGAGPEGLPALLTAVKDAKATRELMFTLRHFHLGDPGARDQLEVVGIDCLPALLDPFRDTSKLRYDYPLFLFPPAEGDGDQQADALTCRLADWLESAVKRFAPGDGDARILRDHLPWIEYHLRQVLKEREGPLLAAPMLGAAGLALQKHLNLGEADRDRLDADLEKLQEEAGQGEVMGYGRFPSLHLLIHALRSRVVPRRVRFQSQVDDCIRGLKSLFAVEWGKSDQSIEPRQARDSVGPGGSRFDPLALSTVMDHSRGTRAMHPERRERIERALAVLEAWRPDPVLVRFVHLGTVAGDWLAESPDVEDVSDPDPCALATDLFDREAERLAEVFSAVRVARLEMDGIYDPALHDPWFANFDWEGFSPEELLLVPSVIALEAADRVAGDDMRSFSRLLSSGRPVQILVRVQPSNDPGVGPEEDPFQNYRTELGYLGLSHRQAAVSQSSAARHQHLMECFLSALDATRTSLHLINTGLRLPHDLVPLNAWMVAGAAIESRAHPFFRVDPKADDCEPAAMDFSDNPHPERDWPVHPFEYLDENGNRVTQDLAFTFADYCLLIQRLQDHFRLIPPGCDSQALIPMQDYLSMNPDQAYRRVPFVWAVDGNSILHRLVVSRELALACLDRLNYWRTLQAMAGVRNHHVDLAEERTRNEERQRATEERERLLAEHAAELERVRNQAAGVAMQRLTDVLLGMDVATGIPGGLRPPTPAAEPAAGSAPAPEDAGREDQTQAPVEEEAEDLSFDEPWIDTPLCTSCNDCLKINPLLFVYNEEKQALLGDLDTATYAQLVEAAELCPAKCIHPGKPWNPEEPELEKLIERAAPFNQ